jgi:hypothetical protein
MLQLKHICFQMLVLVFCLVDDFIQSGGFVKLLNVALHRRLLIVAMSFPSCFCAVAQSSLLRDFFLQHHYFLL